MPQTEPTTEGTTDTSMFQRSPRFAAPENHEAVVAGRIARREARRLRKPGHRLVPVANARADLCWAPKDKLASFEGLPESTDERRARGDFYRLVVRPGTIVPHAEVKPGIIELPVALMVALNLPEDQSMEYAIGGGMTGVVHLQTGFRNTIVAHPSTCASFVSVVRLAAPCNPGQGFSFELGPPSPS